MNATNNGVPGWLVFVGSTLIALVAVGTVSLLVILGRPVPQELWLMIAVISTAYFGSGPFLGMLSHNANTSHQLLDTVNHGLAVLDRSVQAISGMSAGTTTGTQSAKSSPSGGSVAVRIGGGE